MTAKGRQLTKSATPPKLPKSEQGNRGDWASALWMRRTSNVTGKAVNIFLYKAAFCHHSVYPTWNRDFSFENDNDYHANQQKRIRLAKMNPMGAIISQLEYTLTVSQPEMIFALPIRSLEVGQTKTGHGLQ